MAHSHPTPNGNNSVDINGLVLDVFNIIDDIEEKKENKLPIIHAQSEEVNKNNNNELPPIITTTESQPKSESKTITKSKKENKSELTQLSQHIEMNEMKEEEENNVNTSSTRNANYGEQNQIVPTTIGATKKEYAQQRKLNILETDREEDRELLSSIVHDDLRAIRCRGFRFLLVGIVILSYFGYQLSKYLDST
eukprot:91447_1